jgi:hypothetical protein
MIPIYSSVMIVRHIPFHFLHEPFNILVCNVSKIKFLVSSFHFSHSYPFGVSSINFSASFLVSLRNPVTRSTSRPIFLGLAGLCFGVFWVIVYSLGSLMHLYLINGSVEIACFGVVVWILYYIKYGCIRYIYEAYSHPCK